MSRKISLMCSAAIVPALFASPAFAQAFPSKPVRIITQFAPGSSGDTTLRTLAPILTVDFGQPVVIDNRAGGGGMVAA